MLSPFEWCVATSFYQSSANHVSFFLLFNLRNLLYRIWLDASIITTLNNGLQEMLAGTMEPENLAEQVQQSYADYLAFK